MTLNERYRIHNKRKSNKLLIVYIFLAILFLFSSSFSRYASTSEVYAGVNLAKWSIKINNTEITQDTNFIENDISLIVTENQSNDDIIRPGQKGYFDIVIDPQYTEVSLNYSIIIDTSSLPKNIVLEKYSINDFNTKINMPNDLKFEEVILLDGRNNLESADIKTYRIYWNWPIEEGFINENTNDYKVKVKVQVEQIINEI